MIAAVNVMEKSYKTPLPYGKEKINANLTREDERMINAERRRPYLVRDNLIATLNEMTRTVDQNVERDLAANFAWSLVNIFEEKTIQSVHGNCAQFTCIMWCKCFKLFQV